MSDYELVQVTEPAQLAVSLSDAKECLRIPQSDNADDSYITLLIKAATEVVESVTRRRFINRTFRYYRDSFPSGDLELPVAPVSSVASYKYWDYATSLETVYNSSKWQLKTSSILPVISLNDGETYPQIVASKLNAVSVEFTAGYGATDASVPATAKAAILFLVAHWFLHREPVISGTATLSNKIPRTFDFVVSTLKIPKPV